jgi:Uncharacterized protein conserved in bacteria
MSEEKKASPQTDEPDEELKVPIMGYVTLLVAIVIFSGLFTKMQGPITVLDFNTIAGKFGSIQATATQVTNFYGAGGYGARDGFLYAFTLFPLVMLALGIIAVVDHLGGLKAAQKLMTPILRPVMNVPGIGALAMITALQSADGSAAMIKILKESGRITEKEKSIFAAWMFSAGGTISNFFSIGAAMFTLIKLPVIMILVTMIFFKFFGAVLMRLYLEKIYKGDLK